MSKNPTVKNLAFRVVPVAAELEFHLVSEVGETLLTGSGFAERDACIAGIQAVIDVLSDEDRYAVRAHAEGWMLTLTAADDVSRAQSGVLPDEQAASALRDSLIEAASEQETYDIVLPGTGVQRSLGAFVFEALPGDPAEWYDFTRASLTGIAGFELFQAADEGSFYFHVNGVDGVALLFSREFRAASQRNQRMRMVAKCGVLPQRYERREEDGRHFFILKARNGQEIARSRAFANIALMEASLVWLLAEMPLFASSFAGRGGRTRRKDSFHFELVSLSAVAGFELLRHAVDKLYYFLFHSDDGQTLLFSRGYAARASRDQAVRNLIRLGANASRYELTQNVEQHGFAVRAGNGHILARSREFESANAAAAAMTLAQTQIVTHAAMWGVGLSELETTQEEHLALRAERAEPLPIPAVAADLAAAAVTVEAAEAAFLPIEADTEVETETKLPENIRLAEADEAVTTAPLPELFAGGATEQVEAESEAQPEALFEEQSTEQLKEPFEVQPEAQSFAAADLPLPPAAPIVNVTPLEAAPLEAVLVPAPVAEPQASEADAPAPVEPIAAAIVETRVEDAPRSDVKDAVGGKDANKDTDKFMVGGTGKRRGAFGAFAPLSCCLSLGAVAAVCLLLFLYLRFANRSGQPRSIAGNKTGAGQGIASAPLLLPAPSRPLPSAAATPVAVSALPTPSAPTAPIVRPAATARIPAALPAAPPRFPHSTAHMETALAAYLRRPGGGKARTFVMDRLRYPANSHAMNPEGIDEVQALADVVLAHPHARLAIRGYLDGRESEYYAPNDGHGMHQLSRIRAQCLFLRLHFLGVSGERMSISGEGKSHPVTNDATKEARQANRRIEIVVHPS